MLEPTFFLPQDSPAEAASQGDVPAQGPPGSATGTPSGPPAGGLFAGIAPLLLVVAIFWVLVIMPQGKERKRRAKMLAELAKDDQVMTTGGLYGKVAKVEGDVITLQVADGVRMRFHKQSIQTVVGEAAGSEAPTENARA